MADSKLAEDNEDGVRAIVVHKERRVWLKNGRKIPRSDGYEQWRYDLMDQEDIDSGLGEGIVGWVHVKRDNVKDDEWCPAYNVDPVI